MATHKLDKNYDIIAAIVKHHNYSRYKEGTVSQGYLIESQYYIKELRSEMGIVYDKDHEWCMNLLQRNRPVPYEYPYSGAMTWKVHDPLEGVWLNALKICVDHFWITQYHSLTPKNLLLMTESFLKVKPYGDCYDFHNWCEGAYQQQAHREASGQTELRLKFKGPLGDSDDTINHEMYGHFLH